MCTFPSELLASSSFRSLTALHLIRVGVTAKVIYHFLSHSISFKVQCSLCLGNLKVSGPSLLNYLGLKNNKVGSVEISAVNLLSFEYVIDCKRMCLKNVPHLTKVVFQFVTIRIDRTEAIWFFRLAVSTGEAYTGHYIYVLSTLIVGGFAIPSFSSFSNLKEMLLTFDATDGKWIMYALSMIEVSPSLHRCSWFGGI